MHNAQQLSLTAIWANRAVPRSPGHIAICLGHRGQRVHFNVDDSSGPPRRTYFIYGHADRNPIRAQKRSSASVSLIDEPAVRCHGDRVEFVVKAQVFGDFELVEYIVTLVHIFRLAVLRQRALDQ